MPLTEAIVGGVLTMVGSMIANSISKNQTRQNMKYQQQLNDESTDKLNAYNSPQSQMLRYGAAGLNPDLIYGQSNAGSSVLSSTDAPASHMSNFMGDAVQAANQSRLAQSQIDLNESAAEKNYADAGESRSHSNYLDRLTLSQEVVDLVGYANARKLSSESDRIAGLMMNDEIQRNILSEDLIQKEIETQHYDDKLSAEIDLMVKDLELKDAQADKFRADVYAIYAKTPAEVAELYSRSDKENALVKYYDGQTAALGQAIWQAMPYNEGLQKNGGNVSDYDFSGNGSKALAYGDQALSKGVGHAKNICGIVTDIITGGRAKAATDAIRNGIDRGKQVRETVTTSHHRDGSISRSTSVTRSRNSY